MQEYLDRIVARKRIEVAPLAAAFEKAPPMNKAKREGQFAAALRGLGLSVIAEIKRKSPSVGEIKNIADPVALSELYCQGGAAAISVLTDEKGFGGTIEDLERISKAQKCCPILRKDFVVHPAQIAEAAERGASAVLLITSVLKHELGQFLDYAKHYGLDALVEVHHEEELEIAIAAGAKIIGVNSRDLNTFSVDLQTAERLRPLIPSSIIAIAESGIKSVEDAKRMHRAGYDAVLIGEALVRSENPQEMIEQIRKCHEN